MKKFLVLLSLFAFGCASSGSGDVPDVSGIYQVTEGVRVTTDSWEGTAETELDGLYLTINQAGKVVTLFDCGAVLKDNEDSSFTFALDNCNGYNLDSSGGPGFFFTSGKVIFFEEDKLSAVLQVVGSYPWVEFEFSVDYNFKAKLSVDLMSQACPSCR